MVSDAQLKEAEDIGKGLESQKPKVSSNAPDIFFLKQLMETQPNLVPRAPYDYYKMFEKHLQKKEGYTSQKKIAASEGLGSSGSLYAPFKRIREAIAEMRTTEGTGPVKELPSMDTERLTEILKKGKLVQLDPRALLPPKEHKHYELSRYFQKRRGPRLHSLEILAASIGKNGMYEPPTIQDAGSHNGFIQRPDDGFSRLTAWIMADEAAGGTDKVPVLEYPVCLLVDCTNAEGDLIALEKNKNKDNYDIGDRDYSIVTMYERHPEVYTQTKLCELNNLNKSTMSNLIGAWQDSWPCDIEKDETKQDNPIRKALENRQITTYHGRALARLKNWPKEQKRVANWLLEQVEMVRRRDAYAENYWENNPEPNGSGDVIIKFDTHGVSAGNLMMMVRSVEDKMKDIAQVKKTISQMLKDGTVEQKVHEEDLWDLQKKVSSSITKAAFTAGLRAAGVSITTVKPKAKDLKPSSPAATKEDASSQTSILTSESVIHEPEPEPIKVCANCRVGLGENGEYSCQIGTEPSDENECPVQFMLPGRPSDIRFRCHYCGGITFPDFIEQFDVEVYDSHTEDGFMHRYHALCKHQEELRKLDIKGECHGCIPDHCHLLNITERMELDIEVKHCPQKIALPEKSIKEINKEVKKQLEHFVMQAREYFEKSKTTTDVAAGRSD